MTTPRNHSEDPHKTARSVFWTSIHDYDPGGELLYQCPICERDTTETDFEVHHINHDPHDNRRVNLVGFCHDCHVEYHRQHTFNDPFWPQFVVEPLSPENPDDIQRKLDVIAAAFDTPE